MFVVSSLTIPVIALCSSPSWDGADRGWCMRMVIDLTPTPGITILYYSILLHPILRILDITNILYRRSLGMRMVRWCTSGIDNGLGCA